MSEIGICVHNGHLHSAYMTIAFFRIWQPEDNNNFLLCLHYANVYMQFSLGIYTFMVLNSQAKKPDLHENELF